MSARIGVRAHSRRAPGSREGTKFDFKAVAHHAHQRVRLGERIAAAEKASDLAEAERLRRELAELETRRP